MSLLIDSSIKVTVILLAALLAVAALRRRSAAARHWILSVAIVCAAVAPAVGAVTPWHIHVEALVPAPAAQPPVAVATTTVVAEPAEAVTNPPADPLRTGVLEAPFTAWSREVLTQPRLLGALWLAGVCLNVLMLAVGLRRLSAITRRGRPVASLRWHALARDIRERMELRVPVQLLECDDSSLLVTWGFNRARILLPRACCEWTDDRAAVVLHHELTHIARGDWLLQIVAELVRALYWFNPVVWFACRRLRQESELACDDAVLATGVGGADYASHLVDLARALSVARRTSLPAPAMARPSSLEGRVAAMLNPHINRHPISRTWRAGVIALLVGLSAAVAAAQGSFFTFSGVVVDETNRTIPSASLVLTSTQRQATYTVKTDDTGRFAFVGLPSGDYTLEVGQMGFSTLNEPIRVAGASLDRTVRLQVGTLEESMTVSTRTRPAPEVSSDVIEAARQRAKDRTQQALQQCSGSAAGGTILAPIPVVHVNPIYPEAARSQNIGGVVKMEAHIGTDGSVVDVRSTDASNPPELESALVDAVRQWQFSPTLLNCVPVEVNMKITANFVVQP